MWRRVIIFAVPTILLTVACGSDVTDTGVTASTPVGAPAELPDASAGWEFDANGPMFAPDPRIEPEPPAPATLARSRYLTARATEPFLLTWRNPGSHSPRHWCALVRRIQEGI